ncbi:MAG: zeta toxin family protein [Deltaproteobacteria bacterium]|nr:zeta toxin family protein [Deltaproteobacteria bacterium]
MAEPGPVPVFWGNQKWIIDESGALVPGDALKAGDPGWQDYAGVQGVSADLAASSHPDRLFRTQLQDQIVRRTVAGLEKYQDGTSHCILTHGGIASGKTSAVDAFLEANERKEYLRIDFDRVKQQLPEFVHMKAAGLKHAATFVQSESAKIAGRILKKAINQRCSIIYEGSLLKVDSISERIRAMKKKEYIVTVVSTHVTEPTGQLRAAKRYEEGGRYVPPDVVSETYKKCPAALVQLKSLVDVVLLVNNETKAAPMILTKRDSAQVLDNDLYEQYLQCVGRENCLK